MDSKDAIDDIVGFLSDLFLRRGAESYLGEGVSMSEHMVQTAQHARQAGASDSLMAAALLHDVGHFVSDFPLDALERGVNNFHEEAAADFLSHWYPPAVTEPIRLHVPAKRYLCSVEPDYAGKLSDASVHTLRLQGGVMTPREAAAFEAEPYAQDATEIRRWDDAGKVAGAVTYDFEHFRPLLKRLAQEQTGSHST